LIFFAGTRLGWISMKLFFNRSGCGGCGAMMLEV